MKSKLQNRKQNGFTIIEVLIVLAIAGLIMLIVFLAVPALQRSQRNNGRKSDANRIMAAVLEYPTHHNNASPGAGSTADIISAAGKLNIYNNPGDLIIDDATNLSPTAPQINTSPIDSSSGGTQRLHVVLGAQCSAPLPGVDFYPGGIVTQHYSPSGNINITIKQVAIKYALETSNGLVAVCQDY